MGDRIPIGVFYKNEHVPTFEERIAQRVPTYMDHPPASSRSRARTASRGRT